MVASITRRRFLTQTGGAALATGIGGTLFSACGSSSSSGPVTLTYGWWSNGPTKDNAMLAWIKSFTSTHPTIKINAEILPWANYWTKLQTTVAGGNAYDIIGMAGGSAAPYFSQGALLDLSTFSDYKDVSKNLIQSSVQLCNWNGKQYGLPVGVYVPLLGYNKSLLAKAGIPNPDPVTPMELSDFMAMVPKLSLQSGGKYTQYAININDFDLMTAFVYMEGGKFYDNLVNPKKVLVNSPEGIRGLADFQNLYTKNATVPFTQQTNGPFGAGDIDSLLTNKVAFARLGAFDFAQIVQQNLQSQVGVAPLFSINGKQVTMGNANSFAIFSNSKNAEAAWEFIKWATSTTGDTQFAKISDVPADKTAFSQMQSFITPAEYVATLTSAEKGFMPIVMTPQQQFSTDATDITTDLANGKSTPAQAAALFETKGNADLAATS
jgi:multiple sugar transport system substrate-binding protein